MSTLDFMPTSLMKSFADVMAPVIVGLANRSFSTGVFPINVETWPCNSTAEEAWSGRDCHGQLSAISNLSTLSKLLEMLVLSRLRPHVLSSGNFSEFQSAYRAGQSTETALLRVFNDVVRNIDNQRVTVLLALDISAAFDTITFDVLADRLKVDFGIDGVALEWLLSFLIDQIQYVTVGSSRSTPIACLSGVPRGNVFGLLLFALYLKNVGVAVGISFLSHLEAEI